MREMSIAKAGGRVSDEESIRLVDYPDSTEEIPTIDFASYLAGEPGANERVARQLREVSENIGFFYLTGHGIPQALLDRLFNEARRFHALPEEVKAAIPLVNNGVYRSGYLPSGRPRAANSNANILSGTKPNSQSSFSINNEGRETRQGGRNFSIANVWPGSLPGFRETVLEYHTRIGTLARQFLPLWATSLDLPGDYFARFFEHPQLTLSLLHYPPQKEIGDRQYGSSPHADSTFMTLLAQSDVPGLAVQMPSGHWRTVDIVPGALVVNSGHALARWTNDRYLSTKHRVINTAGVERYSAPAFFGPSPDSIIECLPTCHDVANPVRYPHQSYFELREWFHGRE
jgi:isopenicillin N synthase-like dioxygenase